MSKAFECNDKIIKKQEHKVKDVCSKYYQKRCSKAMLDKENKKLYNDYLNLEKLICEETNKQM